MYESARAGYIKFEPAPDPKLIAGGIVALQYGLDRADEGVSSSFDGKIADDSTAEQERSAWMALAFMLADLADVDSVTLHNLRCSILGVTQDALFG
jgi:hypothetical protein